MERPLPLPRRRFEATVRVAADDLAAVRNALRQVEFAILAGKCAAASRGDCGWWLEITEDVSLKE